MDGKHEALKNRQTVMTWACMALFLLIFAYCVPRTSDDWYYFHPYGSEGLLRQALRITTNTWRTTNGRLLGNFFAVLAASSKAFRTLYLAGGLMALLALVRMLLFRGRGAHTWMPALFLLLLFVSPKAWFSGNIAWLPAFTNYITPLILATAYLVRMRGLFTGEAARDTVGGCALCFALGIVGQLYNEPMTVYCLLMAAAIAAWWWIRFRKPSWQAIAYLAGTIAGTMAMLSSPAYAVIASDAGVKTYQQVATGIPEMISMALQNYPYVAAYAIGGNLVPVGCVSAISIALVAGDCERRIGWPRISAALIAALAAAPLYFYFTTQDMAALLPFSTLFGRVWMAVLLDALVYAAYVLSVLAVLIFYVRDAFIKRFGCFLLLSVLALAAPLLFAQPLAHRLFAAGYVFLCLLALALLQYALYLFPRFGRVIAAVTASLTVAVCAIYLCMFLKNPRIEREKMAFIEWRMTYGETTIYTPDFLYEQRLWYPESEHWAKYYYHTRGDIEFEHIPYDMWLERYYDGSALAEDTG